jgi:hypothetical protein
VSINVVLVIIVVVSLFLVVLADFGVLGWLRQRFQTPTGEAWAQGAPSRDAESDAPSADQVYLTSAQRFLDIQVTTNDVLDTKSAGVVGVGSTILPLTFGLLSISGKALPGATQWCLVAAVVAYIALLVAAARTSYIRAIEYRPNIRTLWENSQNFEGAVLRRWVAEEYAASTEINNLVLEYKARWVGRVVLLLYVEGMLISAAAGLALVGLT